MKETTLREKMAKTVSYTHLDVYKRQGLEIPVDMKRRAGIPIDICYKYKNRHMDISSDMNNAQSNHAEDEKTADNSEKCIVELQNVSYSYVNGNESFQALSDINLSLIHI